jgi:hypothetical protein
MKDGRLAPGVGRLIVYGKLSIHSNGPSRDHNDLITALAARYGTSRSDVASGAARFYWRSNGRRSIVISPVRRIDEEWAVSHPSVFKAIVDREFSRH